MYGTQVYRISEITQRNGHYAIQGHSRSPILIPIGSSYDFLLVINTNLPPILQRFQIYGWLLVKFSLARGDCLNLTLSLGVIPCQYRYKWYIAKTWLFGLHFRCRRYCCIFNHFSTILPESYRIRWNYAAVGAITSLKVIQGHRVWYQSKAHMRLPIPIERWKLCRLIRILAT